MTGPRGAVRVDEPHQTRRPRWPWVLLAVLVVLIALLIVFLASGWLSVDFTGGAVEAPDVDVDSNLPDVDVDPGELPDVDVEGSPSN